MVKNPPGKGGDVREFSPRVGKIAWRRKWQYTPFSRQEYSSILRSLVGEQFLPSLPLNAANIGSWSSLLGEESKGAQDAASIHFRTSK